MEARTLEGQAGPAPQAAQNGKQHNGQEAAIGVATGDNPTNGHAKNGNGHANTGLDAENGYNAIVDAADDERALTARERQEAVRERAVAQHRVLVAQTAHKEALARFKAADAAWKEAWLN